MMLILHHTPLHAPLRCNYLNEGSTVFPLLLKVYSFTEIQVFILDK